MPAGALFVLLSLMQDIFLFKMDVLRVTRVVQFILTQSTFGLFMSHNSSANGVFMETSSDTVRQNKKLVSISKGL